VNGLFNLPEAEPVGEEIELPEDATSLHFMQAIYRNPAQPMTRRMRAAVAALPFEHPKLAVTASLNNEGFAAQMEEMVRRSGRSNVIDGKANYRTDRALPVPQPVVSDPAEGFIKRKL
jgi:hypothetical protein